MSKRWKKTGNRREETGKVGRLVNDLRADTRPLAAGLAAARKRLHAVDAPAGLRICGAGGPLELEAQATAGDGKRLRRFSMTAYTGGPMRVEGFFHPVVVDLAGLAVTGQQRPILRDHDPTQIVGHTDTIDVTAQRLKVAGVISGVGDAAQEVLALAANDFPWQASVGASIEKMEFVEANSKATVNGRVVNGPALVVRASTLREVSFVPIGADAHTSASVAARQDRGMAMNFEQWLQANGFDAATLNDTQKAALKAAWQATATPQPVPTPTPPPLPQPAPQPAPQTPPEEERGGRRTIDDIVAVARNEQERRTAITNIVARAVIERPDQLEAIELLGKQALEGKWQPDRLDLELLRLGRPQGSGFVAAAREQVPPEEVIECAVCMSGGLANLEEHFEERTLEAARKKWKYGLGLGELILMSAHRTGFRGLNLKGNLASALKAAFLPPAEVRAGMTGPSTYSLPNILSNVANKFLKMGFDGVDTAWREIAAIRSVNDFKQITSFSLSGDLTYDKVAPGGELKHGTIGETVYTNQADTYGRLLGLDRRDLINDDTGALSGAGRRLGRGAALKLNDVFWTEFLNNSAFFTAGNNNVITGATSVLSGATGLAALDLAEQKFRSQTDPDGKPLGIFPRILLAPTALRVSAMNLMNSTMVTGDTTANSLMPTANAFAGAYRVVSSPYMSNSAFTGFSTTAWYLLADPMELATIEVAFLNGVQTPTVESADFDFNTLGVAMRGFHDFGVNLQEFRAGVRAAGA